MKQAQFEQLHQTLWQDLEAHMRLHPRGHGQTAAQKKSLLANYRALCQQLALARARAYSPLLITRLAALAESVHQSIYQARTQRVAHSMVYFFTAGFAQAVRREWRAMALSSLLFWGLGILVGVLVFWQPQWIYFVMDGPTVEQFTEMYDPANPHLGRTEKNYDQSRVMMFGFYILNNTSIGLKVFASGLLWGLGTVVQLVFNAVHIGAVAGYLTSKGFVSTFWGFVAGHSAFELGAITISGASGLILGKGVLKATTLRRLDYLLVQARRALPLIVGASVMFVLAAGIEGFWSPDPSVPPKVKYAVGVFLMVVTLAYFLRVGRSQPLNHLIDGDDDEAFTLARATAQTVLEDKRLQTPPRHVAFTVVSEPQSSVVAGGRGAD